MVCSIFQNSNIESLPLISRDLFLSLLQYLLLAHKANVALLCSCKSPSNPNQRKRKRERIRRRVSSNMSCNGCRVLRKGCSENCILRPCLQWIETAEAQGHATVFVAKFFGRAGLMSFISAVPESQRPALFQSLLYEACGRTVNPVNGAVGLLWTGNWHICRAAVETVLRGGALRPIPELLTHGGGFAGFPSPTSDEASEICTEILNLQQDGASERNTYHHCRFSSSRSRSTASPPKRKRLASEQPSSGLDLSLIPNLPVKTATCKEETRRPGTPSMNSEESVTTTSSFWGNAAVERYGNSGEESTKLLNLFV